MSKTHPSKSKAAQAKTKAAAKPGSAPKKPQTASKPVAKKAASKKPVKKVALVKSKPTLPAKKTAPVKKGSSAKKAAPAKKTAVKKVPVKKTTSPKKVAVSTKKGGATKKAAPVKKAPSPAKKIPQPKAPVKKEVAAPAPKKPVKAAKPVITKAAVKLAVVLPSPKAVPQKAPAATPAKGKQAKAKGAPLAEATAALPIAPPSRPQLSEEKPEAVKSGALFYDSHMHTPLCKHAWGEPEEYAAQALKSGLKGIIFTCHCPMPDGFWPSVRMANSEFDTYVDLVRRAADAYAGQLDVCLGLESEFFPGHEKWIADLHQRADFDYILGAVHWQSKDYLTKFETGTIENFRRIYFEHLAQSAETGLYDCLAHPDLVKNYHPDSWCFAIVKDTVAGALDRIAKTGVAMELNTSGLNKSYSEMNPGNEMLRMMSERGIPVVIGSDSHKAVRVGEHFITALNNLAEAGYENVSYFKKRRRIDLKINDVLASIRKAIDANA